MTRLATYEEVREIYEEVIVLSVFVILLTCVVAWLAQELPRAKAIQPATVVYRYLPMKEEAKDE